MTYFEDLTPYTYSPGDDEQPPAEVLNVGWLERGHDFPHGPTPGGLIQGLFELCKRPTHVTRGIHFCDLCERLTPEEYRARWHDLTTFTVDDEKVHIGSAEIRVTGPSGTLYAAPTLIIHYVSTHGYLPPADFIAGALG